MLRVLAIVGLVAVPATQASATSMSRTADDITDRISDQLIEWKLELRDLVRDTFGALASVGDELALGLPDLSVLSAHPVEPSKSTWATSGFGWREDPLRHRKKFHRGADIRAKPGTPVYAAGAGIVVHAKRQGGYGNVIFVDHGGGVITRYAHLRRIEVKVDDVVEAGARIGQVGSTGRTTGPHLHFEVRLDGRAVDPSLAMTVAELTREHPEAARVAAFALAPEVQELVQSDLDPPRTAKGKESRPERKGRTKRVRPVS